MIRFALIFSVFLCASVHAETVVPTHAIRAQTIIGASDLALKPIDVAGTFDRIDDLIGMEAHVTLYPGRAIHLNDVGPASVIERNQIITLIYATSGLAISAEGRALDRAAVGDRIRAMNLTSRTTLFGVVQPNHAVRVSN